MRALVLTSSVVVAVAAVAAAAPVSASPVILDHTQAFLEFWQSHQDEPREARLAAFKTLVEPSYPEFYRYKREHWLTQGRNPDEEIHSMLEDFQSIEPAFRKKSATIASEISEAMTKFTRFFDDFRTDFEIHIAHSLGEMDGGGRRLDGKTHFIFGVDGIVKYHAGVKSELPFYHHELFHKYHGQMFDGPDQIWSALWGEGLATYVSERLNPGSTLTDIMLDNPPGLVQLCEKDLPYLVSTLTGLLESESREDYETFFLFS